jgi:hypothetical protein
VVGACSRLSFIGNQVFKRGKRYVKIDREETTLAVLSRFNSRFSRSNLSSPEDLAA